MTNRDFKGVFIPREVWLDKRLAVADKFILTEIRSMDFESDVYFVEHLADFCGCSKRAVKKSIAKLMKLGYLVESDE